MTHITNAEKVSNNNVKIRKPIRSTSSDHAESAKFQKKVGTKCPRSCKAPMVNVD